MKLFSKKMVSTFKCALVVLAASLMLSGEVLADEPDDVNVYFQPAQIVLNCPPSGNKQNVQASIMMRLTGYKIVSQDVGLLFEDVYVCDAVGLRVARYHLEAGFDRLEVQDFAVEAGLGGTVVKATVEGTFVAESYDGASSVTGNFTGYDYIEILAPGL